MMKLFLILGFFFLGQPQPSENPPLEKSPYFAFADRDYIFTIEIVKPGVPILNFVSMTNRDISLLAKNIRLALENRKAAAKVLAIEGGDFRQPMVVSSITMHPRSSFGVRINGDFGNVSQLYGATIRLGDEDFTLAPLKSFEFEALVLKVDHLNLDSPDFSEDWRVLRLEPLGTRSPARKGSASLPAN